MKFAELKKVLVDEIGSYGYSTEDKEVSYRKCGTPEERLLFAIFDQPKLDELIGGLEVDAVYAGDDGYFVAFKEARYLEVMLDFIFRGKFKFSKTVFYPAK